MKTKKYLILVIVSFSVLIVLLSAQQITGETSQSAKDKKTDSQFTVKRVLTDEKEILQGLEGVRVAVEEIEPKAEEYGLTKKDIQTDTELQLRQYGIKVLTEEERLSTPGAPYLYINVNVHIQESLVVAAAIQVQFSESVLLLRKPKRFCLGACTWQRSSVVSGGLGRIKEVRGSVKDLVNEFINDYLAANPKEQSTTEKDKKPKDN